MYLGNQPALNYISFASQTFSIVNSQTSYTLDHSVVNGLDILLYINNVKQVEGSGKAYTASGNTLTIASPLTSGSDEMYCIYIGKAVQSVVPPSGSVTNAMLGETITVAKGGTGLTSGFANGITEADMYRLTANLAVTGNSSVDITTNLERVDTTNFSKIGTGMSESSGIFTFPSTGIYQVTAIGAFYGGLDTQFFSVRIFTTPDNSTYTTATATNSHTFNGYYAISNNEIFFDVTNTTTHKVKFHLRHHNAGSLLGNTSYNLSFFKFIRLGDT